MRKFGKLTGLQRSALRDAIVGMFPEAHLELTDFLTKWSFGSLATYAAPVLDFPMATNRVVERLYARGRLDSLFQHLESDPDYSSSPELIDLNGRIDLLGPRLEIAAKQLAGLEAMVVQAGFQNPFMWTGRLAEFSRSMCRIRVSSPDGANVLKYGSGFLIAPDRVLTAYHVIEPAAAGSQVLVTFHHAEDKSGPMPTHSCNLAADWVAVRRTYSPGEEAGKDVVPKAEELDFAVLRLLKPVPESIATPVDISGTLPDAPSTVVVLQHPLGGHLQMSIGAITDGPPPHRLRYGGDARGGASGGLVLDFSLVPLAMHHFGSDETGNRFNQGVPLREIAAAIGPIGG